MGSIQKLPFRAMSYEQKKLQELVDAANVGQSVNVSDEQLVEVAVTAAELAAMYVTPKQIVPDPGAGYTTEFLGAVIFLDYSGAAMTGGGVVTFNHNGVAVSANVAATLLTNTGDKLFQMPSVNAAGGNALVDNKGITLTNATASFVIGAATSVLNVRVRYRIHKTNL